MSWVTEHTRTEKIGGDSIFFSSHPSRSEKPLGQLGNSTGELESRPIFSHMLSSFVICMLDFICHDFLCRYNAHFFMLSFIRIRMMLVLFYISNCEQGW